MSLHTGCYRRLLILFKGICRHGDNRRFGKIMVRQCPDQFCRLISVHDRHLNIHQNQVVISRFGKSKLFHRLLTVFRCFDLESFFLQDRHGNLPVYRVIFHQQQANLGAVPLFIKALMVGNWFFRIGQLQLHDKLAAFSPLGHDLYSATHHINNGLCNGHAETGSLCLADGRRSLPFKWKKNAFGKLRAHPDTAVLDPDFIYPGCLSRICLLQFQRNLSALRCKLVRVAEDVHQNTVQPIAVTHHPVRLYLGLNTVLDTFCCHLSIHQFSCFAHMGINVNGCRFQFELSIFDAAHLQNVINNRQKLLTGALNLFQILLLFLQAQSIPFGKRRIAQNRIQGCADIMGHIGKEKCLGSVCILCCQETRFQLFIFLDPIRNTPNQPLNDRDKNTAAKENA